MRNKRIFTFITLLTLFVGAFIAPVNTYGAEVTATETEKQASGLVAGEEEKAPAQKVGKEGMTPVYGTDIADGTYPIEVESSSSMFRIVNAELTVSEGKMSAVITLGGKGYLKLFMGTGEEAVAAEESAYANYIENAEGAYTYEIPVEALNKELECTGFSKRKEKWYDHQICFDASTLPAEALLIELSTETVSAEDGSYKMNVELAGGSGKATIETPATVTVKGKKMVATIVWSSPNYDYMIVNGEKYLPVNKEGNSTFEIPVLVFDEEMPVVADTVAMGTPHEIEYTLTFDTDSMEKEESSDIMEIAAVAAVLLLAVGSLVLAKKRKQIK